MMQRRAPTRPAAPPASRAADGFSVADLRRDGIVGADEIRSAAAAYLDDPACSPFKLRNGHTVDVAAAVEGHRLTAKALADPETPIGNRRILVQAVLALARTDPSSPTD